MATVRSVLIRIGVAHRGVEAGINRVNRSLESLNRHTDKIGKAARTGGLVVLASSAVSLAAALGPAAGGLFALSASMAAALAPAAGLAVALPAVAVAWKVSMAVMTLATKGFSDSLGAAISGDMTKFNESLKAMPPAARSVARQLGAAFKGLQQTVQQAFFRPVAAEAKGLGAQLRGPLQSGMARVAAAMGGVAAKAVAVAREGASIRLLDSLFRNLGQAITNAGKGVAPLLRGLRAIIGVGLGKLPALGTWVGRIAADFGRWLQHIVRSGRAAQWFTGAVATLRTLGTIARNVGITIGMVFRAATFHGGGFLTTLAGLTQRMAAWAQSVRGQAQMIGFFDRGRQVLGQLAAIAGNLGVALGNIFRSTGTQGNSLLVTIQQLTEKFAAWTGSAQGQQQLSQTFALLGQVAANLLTILPGVLGVLAQITSFINSMPGPVRNVVTQFLAWSIVIGLVSSKIAPLLLGIGKISGGLLKLGRDLADPTSKLGRFVRFAGSMIASLARGAASLAMSMARATASFLMSAARMTASMAMTVARVVIGWTLMGLRALASAAMMALSWLVALGPIPLIIAAVIGLGVLIFKNWDKIKKWTVQAWGFVWGWIKKIWNFIKNLFLTVHPVGIIIRHWNTIKTKTIAAFNAVWGFIKKIANFIKELFMRVHPVGIILRHWDQIKNGVVSRAKGLVNWIKGLPGRIRNGLGNLGRLLHNAGRDVLTGLWNGIVSMAGRIQRMIGDLVRNIIPGPVRRVLGIRSPSKVFHGFGRNIGQGLVGGMQATHGMVARAAAGLASAAVPEMGTAGAVGMATPAGVAAAAGGGALAAGGFDYARMAEANVQAFGRAGLTVQMDKKVVGEIVSQENGRVTSQRRRTH